jgi:hypothetical protein
MIKQSIRGQIVAITVGLIILMVATDVLSMVDGWAGGSSAR